MPTFAAHCWILPYSFRIFFDCLSATDAGRETEDERSFTSPSFLNSSFLILNSSLSRRSTFASAGWMSENIGTSVPAVSMPQKTPITIRRRYFLAKPHSRPYASLAVYSRSKNSCL